MVSFLTTLVVGSIKLLILESSFKGRALVTASMNGMKRGF